MFHNESSMFHDESSMFHVRSSGTYIQYVLGLSTILLTNHDISLSILNACDSLITNRDKTQTNINRK